MISVIITACKEERTVAKAISSLASQLSRSDEILLVAPDETTLNVGVSLKKTYSQLKVLKDFGKGKPSALNLAVSNAKNDILILTDGDVFVSNDAVANLVSKLDNPSIGAVSGRPVSVSPKDTLLGFWSSVLTKVAHERRMKARKIGLRFFCSGYLFAIRKSLFPRLPSELLSEDGYISHKVYGQGYKIDYADDAAVFVKYPSTFSDWIIQKKRSAGGYLQIKSLIGAEIRSFKEESFGALGVMKYAKNVKALFWLIALFLARVYLWVLIYRDVPKKTREEIWQRVESTK